MRCVAVRAVCLYAIRLYQLYACSFVVIFLSYCMRGVIVCAVRLYALGVYMFFHRCTAWLHALYGVIVCAVCAVIVCVALVCTVYTWLYALHT